jgi:hypothetical protein
MSQLRADSVRLVHSSPGRTRVRLEGFDRALERATALADDLAALPGVEEVAVRPWTGSVLCVHDARRLDPKRIVDVVRRHAEQPGAPSRTEPGRPTPALLARQGSSIARSLTALVKQLDGDLLRVTEGRLDLGTLATFGFLAAGAAEVLSSRRLPAPPWFNLAWWALRTFTEFERPAGFASANPPRLVPIASGKARAPGPGGATGRAAPKRRRAR